MKLYRLFSLLLLPLLFCSCATPPEEVESDVAISGYDLDGQFLAQILAIAPYEELLVDTSRPFFSGVILSYIGDRQPLFRTELTRLYGEPAVEAPDLAAWSVRQHRIAVVLKYYDDLKVSQLILLPLRPEFEKPVECRCENCACELCFCEDGVDCACGDVCRKVACKDQAECKKAECRKTECKDQPACKDKEVCKDQPESRKTECKDNVAGEKTERQ